MEAGPIWVSQGTWDANEEHIVVADPGSSRLYVYDQNGKLQRRIARPGRGPLEFEKPNLPFLVGGRFLVGANPYRWVWLNDKLESETGWALEWEQSENRDYSRLAPYEVAVGRTSLFSIAAAQRHNGQWSDWGVYSVSLSDPHTPRSLATIARDEEERSFYLSPPSNLAACGQKVYLLRMAATVSIVEIVTPLRTLRSFPPEFRKRPSIPPLTRDSLPAQRAGMRNAAVSEGLFCIDDQSLLLLGHRPRPQGGVQWMVYPIDPVRDAIGAAIELPTTAGEIVFVPGRKNWAVLEKAPMKRVGIQPLVRMITFKRPTLNTNGPAERQSK